MYKYANCSLFTLYVIGSKLFYYRGCGWKAKRMDWNEEDKAWIEKMDDLFTDLFGPDFFQYEYTETKCCVVNPTQTPLIDYQHEEWESKFMEDKCVQISSNATTEPQHQSSNTIRVAPAPATTSTQQHESSTGSETPKKGAGAKTPQQSCNAVGIKPTPEPTAHHQGSSTCTATTSSAHCPSDQDLKPENEGMMFENLNILTRGERAALKLPRVTSISKADIEVVQGQVEVTNPLLVNCRPPESAVTHAANLLKELSSSTCRTGGTINVEEPEDGDEDEKATVTMGTLGTFTQESIGLYQTMCSLAAEAVRFREENLWLANGSNSLPDLTKVRAVLCNSRPHEEISRQGTCIMDATDFSTLACERYVNGFTIDVICLRFLEEDKPTNFVYLSSYSQTWAKQGPRYFSQMVMPFFTHCAVQDATCLLAPFHFDSPQHWGLLCFDVASKTVYFDDGLKINPPREVILVIKNMLSGFELLSQNVIFKEKNWNHPKLDLPLPRLNMPEQTKTGEGSASCGVGVILTVRDIVKSRTCHPSFQWMFKNMASLRKELMALVVQWKK